MTDQTTALLAGVRVLDLSQYLPGPYATQLLADMGAEVVKVEPPAGDPMRFLDQPAESDRGSPVYRAINAGKTVINLNLKEEADRVVLRDLVARADILLESFRPGVMARLGFSPDDLRGMNARLVHVALSGWGQTGPYAARAGHDINYLALAGGLAATGTADEPVAPFPPTGDMASGMMAALSALGGLLRTRATGEGCFLDVSIMETALSWQSFGLAAAAGGAPIQRGQSLLSGGAACYHLYRTADDRWLSVGAIEAKFWQLFCDTLQHPEWAARQHEQPMPQTGLIGAVQAVIAEQSLDHWCDVFRDVDCCVEPVLDWHEIAHHEHIAARSQIDASGDIPAALIGLRIDGNAPVPRRPVRSLGAPAVLAAWQGD